MNSNQIVSPGSSRRQGKASLVALVLLLLLAAVTVFAGGRTNFPYGQIPQGGQGTFEADSNQHTQADAHWEISAPAQGMVARASKPNGWSVSFDGSNFNVSVPPDATVADGYKVRYRGSSQLQGSFASGSFGVMPAGSGGTAGSTAASTGTTATTGSTSGTTGSTSGTTGSSAGGGGTLKIVDVEETRAHVLTVDFEADSFGAYGSSSTVAGETTTTAIRFYACSDNALSDPLTTSATGATPGTFTALADTMGAGGTFKMTGFFIPSNAFDFTLTPPSAGGTARIFIAETDETTTSHVSGGMTIQDSDSIVTSLVLRRDYNLVKQLADAVPIDSRKVYGQPDLAGEIFADANAPLRNPSFLGWTYNGGIFAGNSPAPSGDQSGTARTQFYLTSTPTYTNPVWEDLVLCYLGPATSFSSDPSYYFSVPSTSDPNIATSEAATTWATAWSLSTATHETSLNLGSLSWGAYANFQSTAFTTKVILSLASESADISGNVADWRYFATPAFASGSGLLSATDAQPHAWVLDQTLGEH